MGSVELGIVNAYDPATCTAEVTSYDGVNRYYNVGVSMSSYDTANGVYSYTPPSIGAPCLFTTVGGETFIIGQYAPPNIGYAPDTISPISTTVNRAVDEMGKTDDHLPGDWQMTSQSGAEISFRNMLFSIKMNPLFYSVWNILNGIWDNMCNIFKFKSSGADVSVNVDEAGNTNTSIQVRTSSSQADGTPAVDLQIGADAGVILLKINGNNFCHIDENRHVILETDDIDLTAKDVHVTAENMIVKGAKLDCSGVGRVRLPR